MVTVLLLAPGPINISTTKLAEQTIFDSVIGVAAMGSLPPDGTLELGQSGAALVQL